VAELAREHGVSEATLYGWKSKKITNQKLLWVSCALMGAIATRVLEKVWR
jgi:transposase-like protein